MVSIRRQGNHKKPNIQSKQKPEDQMTYLIKIAIVLAFAVVASGNLPSIHLHVKNAQLQLIQESKASKWPKAMTFPTK